MSLRSFRSYERAELELGSGVTVVCGANGSGKTNLIEALYFGCTGRSCRTTNERELVRFGDDLARVEADVVDGGVRHRLAAGLAPGNPKHMTVDTNPVDSLLTAPERPLLSVFLPERMELVKEHRDYAEHISTALSPRSGPTVPRPGARSGGPWLSATPCSAGSVPVWREPRHSTPGTRSCHAAPPR